MTWKLNFKKISLFILCGIWVVTLGICFGKLFLYSTVPGEHTLPNPPSKVIGNLPVPASSELVVFVHPQCSCSRATLWELEKLLPIISGHAKVTINFFAPKEKFDSWKDTALWKQALSLPGVQVNADPDGFEASRYGAKTSGQVYFYAPDGTLVFEGGITPSRGHMGKSVGGEVIKNYFFNRNASLVQNVSAVKRGSVFGCSLNNIKRSLAGKPL